jgi:hypothetical protein
MACFAAVTSARRCGYIAAIELDLSAGRYGGDLPVNLGVAEKR